LLKTAARAWPSGGGSFDAAHVHFEGGFMSIERARQLLAKLGTDAAFREKIERAAPADRTALLESHGFGDITPADIQAAQTSGTEELSETDLEAVAGGIAHVVVPLPPIGIIQPIDDPIECFPIWPPDKTIQ
jgi:predicted ribosomally synthesized peptide with nif11-like leader